MSATSANSLSPRSVSLSTCICFWKNKHKNKHVSMTANISGCVHNNMSVFEWNICTVIPNIPFWCAYLQLCLAVLVQTAVCGLRLRQCESFTYSTRSTWDIMHSFHLVQGVSWIIDWAIRRTVLNHRLWVVCEFNQVGIQTSWWRVLELIKQCCGGMYNEKGLEPTL